MAMFFYITIMQKAANGYTNGNSLIQVCTPTY